MNLGLSYLKVSNFTMEHKLLALPCQLPLLGVKIWLSWDPVMKIREQTEPSNQTLHTQSTEGLSGGRGSDTWLLPLPMLTASVHADCPCQEF